MNVLIYRKWPKGTYTIGKCYINGVVFSDSLEDKDRGLKDSMTLEEIRKRKVYGKTAIPSGTYTVELTHSNRFCKRIWGKMYAGKVPELKDVKGYSGVRIHPMNTAEDTLGCIGLGVNDRVGMIHQSTKYYYKFMDEYFIPAIKRGEKVTLTIY